MKKKLSAEDEEIAQCLHKQMRKRRKQVGMSQVAVSRACGWPDSTYGDIERGRILFPRITQTIAMAKVFKCRVSEMLTK